MRRNAVQDGKPEAIGPDWPSGPLSAPGSPRVTLRATSAPPGSSGLTARLSSLVSVTGVPSPMWPVGTVATSLSVPHRGIGDGAAARPTRRASTPTCEHGPTLTEREPTPVK